jgi:hypothetical protein
VQSLYTIVNGRGVKQIFTHVMWRILVPPRLHVNKVLTRDNLAKRKNIDDKTCLFCNESETVLHLFFECCVAHQPIWEIISEVSCLPLIKDIQPLSKIW